mmetsp:Transcript_21155/g.55066  ORF Transcript_21155/g.55066 Transcript_21155/m.55066 type:complete len:477 (-) Transcript_21155:271-1701(-)
MDPRAAALGSINSPGDENRKPLLSSDDEGISIETPTQHLDQESSKLKTSFMETLVNFIKGNLGSGFWCLNTAFGRSGWAVGLAGIPFLGLLAMYCMHLLLESKARLRQLHDRKFRAEGGAAVKMDTGRYEDIAGITIGRGAKIAIQVCLVITQFGFCCVCLLFIAEHTQELWPRFTVEQFVWLLVPIVSLLCFIKDFKYIAPTSAIANVLIIYGVIVTIYFFVTVWDERDHRCKKFYDDLKHCRPEEVAPKLIGDAPNIPIFFGMGMYCFQSIGLILPMEVEMQNPKQAPVIVTMGMLLVICMFTSFGFIGYWVVGFSEKEQSKTSISEFLPAGPLYASVKIAINFVLLQTYALQYFPGIQIVESLVDFQGRWGLRGTKLMVTRNILRVIICCITAVIATEVPHLGLVISLVGALGCGGLALICPPVLHLVLYPDIPKWRRNLHKLIVVVGISGVSIAFYTSLVAVLKASAPTNDN